MSHVDKALKGPCRCDDLKGPHPQDNVCTSDMAAALVMAISWKVCDTCVSL